MKNTVSLFIILIIAFLSLGWTSLTHQKIAVDATMLTPYELKLLIRHYKKELLEGCIDPLKGRKDEKHYLLVDNSFGKAHKVVDAIVKSIEQDLKAKKIDLGELCFRLGVLSHYIAEVNNPILTGDLKREGGWFYDGFVRYTEENIPNYALTFDGYHNVFLEQGDYSGFAISSAIRSAKLFNPLKRIFIYRRIKGLGYDFDRKSIPYATASLSYNYAVTDTAKIWYYVWRNISGDVSYAPYANEGKKKK